MNVSTKQHRIAELGQRHPERSFTSLHHYMDMGWLETAYTKLKRRSVPGIDGVSVNQYGLNLASNLAQLLRRVQEGRYRAPALKRGYIPKGDRSQEYRPIGIPATEDKVLQRAVQMVLEPLYEPLFRNCSYGFRPGRSPHMALEALWQCVMNYGGGWILDVDVRKFFDNLDHTHLQVLLKHRVSDGVICRLIGKCLRAGVMEAGCVSYPEKGSPQGSVISPILSNIYLHYVLDEWFEKAVRSKLMGQAELIRFADDFLLVFSCRKDSERVFEVLPKRFKKYGLQLHPQKTRLIDFRRPTGGARSASFDFLGFTHYWGKSRRNRMVVTRKTSRKRLSNALHEIHHWCRKYRHMPVRKQHEKLVLKLRGHYNYYGITGNIRSLRQFFWRVKRTWHYWLNRRSRERCLTWERFELSVLENCPLPEPRIYHSCYSAKP